MAQGSERHPIQHESEQGKGIHAFGDAVFEFTFQQAHLLALRHFRIKIKERLPDNIGEFTVPLGAPEILRQGEDITIVTYGACCRIALEAADKLNQVGIQAEVVDVQTLLPFDLHSTILNSLKKTSRTLFADDDAG
jgi:pyruvate/2-oxoglutarate/acetoin dehydrogenase E1 component